MQDALFLQILKGLRDSIDRSTLTGILIQEAAVALDRRIVNAEGLDQVGARAFENDVLVQPPRQLALVGHQERVVELSICDLVDTVCYERVELNSPLGGGIVFQFIA